MSPTAEAMETIRPVSATATTAPTSASGSVAITVNARIGDFVAIINPPESAILAVGKIAKTPVVVTNDQGEDEVAIRSMCALCLSYDHRLIDGAEAAKFLQKVKQYLQNPILLI